MLYFRRSRPADDGGGYLKFILISSDMIEVIKQITGDRIPMKLKLLNYVLGRLSCLPMLLVNKYMAKVAVQMVRIAPLFTTKHNYPFSYHKEHLAFLLASPGL
jgi:hypothetical protein